MLDVARKKDMQNYMIDLYEQVTPDSMSQRREMTKEYFSNISRLDNAEERMFQIDFDNLEPEALDAFNGLAIIQNMIEANKSAVVGGDPMLPGMPSELDGTPINPSMQPLSTTSSPVDSVLGFQPANNIEFISNPGERYFRENRCYVAKRHQKRNGRKTTSKKRKFDEKMSKMSFKDRIINFFRTDSTEDRSFQNSLMDFMKDLDLDKEILKEIYKETIL